MYTDAKLKTFILLNIWFGFGGFYDTLKYYRQSKTKLEIFKEDCW